MKLLGTLLLLTLRSGFVALPAWRRCGGTVRVKTRSRRAVLRSDPGPHRRCKLPLSTVLGESNPSPGTRRPKRPAELKAALHDAFAYCSRAYGSLTDANASETVKAFGQERNKLGALWFNASHNLAHGNLVVYASERFLCQSTDPKPSIRTLMDRAVLSATDRSNHLVGRTVEPRCRSSNLKRRSVLLSLLRASFTRDVVFSANVKIKLARYHARRAAS